MKSTVHVEPMIRIIRGQKVILDRDLAALYGVSTMRFNQAIKRNQDRFPADFCFKLSREELTNLISQIVISSSGHGGIRKEPLAFTEHGAIMAATVLNSPKAVEMSVFVVRAFVKMREALSVTQTMEKRLAEVEKTLLVHDTTLWELYERIKPLLLPPPQTPKRRIGFRTEDASR